MSTTSNCSNIYFLDFILPSSGNTFNGSNILVRNGFDLRHWDSNVLVAEYNVGGGAAQLSVKQREFSIFTDFDGTNLSERTRWTRGQATSELQIFNANLKVNDILEFSTGNGVNIEGANIKSGDIKLTTYTSEPTLLFSGYAAFAKIGTQLFLYYKDGAALKRVELT